MIYLQSSSPFHNLRQPSAIKHDHASAFEAHQTLLGQLAQRTPGHLTNSAGTLGQLLMCQNSCTFAGLVQKLTCQALAHRAKSQIFDQHHQVAQLPGHLAQRRQRQVGVFANQLEQRGARQQ